MTRDEQRHALDGEAPMRISYLADKPEFISALAQGTQEEWSQIWPNRTIAWRIERYHAHANRHTLPIAWVVHENDTVLGTVALRAHDFKGMEHLSPWLGGLYVFPEYRSRGLGLKLCTVVEQAALERGAGELYLGTWDQRAWYERTGWTVVKSQVLQGRSCDIMRKRLGSES